MTLWADDEGSITVEAALSLTALLVVFIAQGLISVLLILLGLLRGHMPLGWPTLRPKVTFPWHSPPDW